MFHFKPQNDPFSCSDEKHRLLKTWIIPFSKELDIKKVKDRIGGGNTESVLIRSNKQPLQDERVMEPE